MPEPLENLYFNWLCAKVIDTTIKSPSRTYWELFKILHTTEFVWLLSGDDNRAEDGKDLRREFILAADLPDDPDWRNDTGCSVLEMFVAFSKRAGYMTDRPPYEWFWIFIDNLGLKEFTDDKIDHQEVVDTLEEFIWRMYDEDGNGGLFPMQTFHDDQRNVEVWFQLCEYLVDHDLLD